MARIKVDERAKSREVTKVETYFDKEFVLTLTEAEAEVLMQIVQSIAGTPHEKADFGREYKKWTPRGVADDISEALDLAGIKVPTYRATGSIWIWPDKE